MSTLKSFIIVVIAAGILYFLLQDPKLSEPAAQVPTTPVETQIDLSQELVRTVIQKGEGDVLAKEGDTLAVHYVGTTAATGAQFDANQEGDEPFTFVLGSGQVIPGWDIGLLDMKIGEKRMLTIPPQYAYGQQGIPGVIPPNATLIFEVEVISIN